MGVSESSIRPVSLCGGSGGVGVVPIEVGAAGTLPSFLRFQPVPGRPVRQADLPTLLPKLNGVRLDPCVSV